MRNKERERRVQCVYIYICIYVYMSLCVCVYMSVCDVRECKK